MDLFQSYTAASLQANLRTDRIKRATIKLQYWHYTDLEDPLSVELGSHSRNIHPLNACALYCAELDAAPAAEVNFSSIMVAATGALASFFTDNLECLCVARPRRLLQNLGREDEVAVAVQQHRSHSQIDIVRY